MKNVYDISLPSLLISLLPVLVVAVIYLRWSVGARSVLYATARMFGQLILVGYLLIFIFKQTNPFFMSAVLCFMLAMAAWIAMGPMKEKRLARYPFALLALAAGCLPVLALMLKGILDLKPWYEPAYLIPLSGMVFANAMNSLSLAAERYHNLQGKDRGAAAARGEALKTALIPITNTFLAVGLVSLPGIMTGQILAGISPLVAVRYQIMIMSMLFGASGITAAAYLKMVKE